MSFFQTKFSKLEVCGSDEVIFWHNNKPLASFLAVMGQHLK